MVIALSTKERKVDVVNNAIRELQMGRNNCTGTVSLVANTTTTTVLLPTCSPTSGVFLFPKTAHAAAEVAAGGLYISSVLKGSFIITHANNAQVDRTFFYVVLGGN